MSNKISASGIHCLNCEAENSELRNSLSKLQGIYDDAVASLRENAIELEMADRKIRLLLANLALAEKRAVYDNLTGLFTRYEMEVQIKHHLSLLVRAEHLFKNVEHSNIDAEYFSILFVDLNDFKCINDDCGHKYGDRALSIFANFLKQSFRETDIISRWGGMNLSYYSQGFATIRRLSLWQASKKSSMVYLWNVLMISMCQSEHHLVLLQHPMGRRLELSRKLSRLQIRQCTSIKRNDTLFFFKTLVCFCTRVFLLPICGKMTKWNKKF